MKVSDQVIETLTGEKTSNVKLLEICNAELLFIENLHKCTDLTILNLRGNFIKEVENIYTLKNLWNLDLAHNELTSVTGLSRFVALGSLNLSFNNLTWKSLNDVKHMHICSLQLQGNVEIEKDKHYRTHVVDSLPNVWSLDGKFVSAIERLDVANFMAQSELSKHPIRSKLAKHERFQPSYKKDILTYGVFGSKAEELFMNFPTRDNSLVINSEMDRKKLCYLAYNLQEEIEIEKRYAYDVMECEFADKFMEDLLNVRAVEVERSNMLLILILASLEFTLPLHLVQEMLQTAQLDFLGGVNTVALFEYPRRIRVEMASILTGAAKVDRDENRDGGLYPLLYTALDKMLENLNKVANSDRVQYIKRKYKRDSEFMRLRPIVAAEVVQLLCVTPSFYDIADTDAAVQLLLSLALGNDVVMNKTMTLLSRLRTLEGEGEEQGERGTGEGGEVERERMAIMEDTAKFIVSNVQLNSQDILNGKQLPARITKKNSFERPSTGISVKNLQYRPRSGFKQKEYASTLTWLHEKLSPRRRASSAAPPRTEQLSATTISRADPMNAGIVGRKVAAMERPRSSAGLYNDILRSSRASGSAAYRPTSGKRTPLPPRIGDVVLLGAQNSGHIISVPDRNTALIMVSEATAQNGGVVSRLTTDEDRYVYVRLDELQFDFSFGWWKPKHFIGDRVTLVDPKRLGGSHLPLDPAQLAFETRVQYNSTSGHQQDSLLPQSSFHASLVTSLANTERTLHSPDKDSSQTTDSPCKSPAEWTTAGQSSNSNRNNLTGVSDFNADDQHIKEDENEDDAASDSTKGMSRASSPADPEPNESPSSQIHSEIIRVASQLSEDIIELAIKEVANSPTNNDQKAKESEKQELTSNEEVKVDEFEENHGVLQGALHGVQQGATENVEMISDSGAQNEFNLHDMNVEIKQRKTERGAEVENEQSSGQWPDGAGKFSTSADEKEKVVHVEGMAVGPDVQIDLDDVITSESNVFINKERSHENVGLDHDGENESPTLSYREIRFSPRNTTWVKGYGIEQYPNSTDYQSFAHTAAGVAQHPGGFPSPPPSGRNGFLSPRRAKSASTSSAAGRLYRAKQISPSVKSGSRWLAGGRNVYKPVEMTESYLIPGWVQSMEPRAKRAYMRRMINKYSEGAQFPKSSSSSSSGGVPRGVSIRAMSAQMKSVCGECSSTSRKQLMDRYYTPHILPKISDTETYWQHYI